LVHNGQMLGETHGDRMEHEVRSAGLYRVEAWRWGRGWIFSNHIRIGMGS